MWAKEHPLKTISLAWTKLRRTWSIRIHASEYASPFYTLIAWLTVAPEYALIIGGIWLMRRRTGPLLLLLMPAIYFTLLHMVFIGSIRYRVPAMPLLFVLAGVTTDRLLSRFRRSPAA